MAFPRILLLEKYPAARGVLVLALRQLGVCDILQASDPEEALVQMQLQGGVDIVLCNLLNREQDCLEFLSLASHSGLVRAVAVCSALQPELQRTLGQMASLAGLQLLGVLNEPLQLSALRRTLQRYQPDQVAPQPAPRVPVLPSEDDVRRGLALGEFRAWFQPQLQLCRKTVVGAEALVRWEHPARGVLLPAEFLGAVLAYDLIDQMFKHLLEQGLYLLGVLRRQGTSLTLAFNLHASQLADSGLVEHIKQALERHGLKGSTLTFELAENGLLVCAPDTRENLLRLRLLGCQLSIDDFGLGFSSFKALCQLPFNQLKLHGKFVQRLDRPRNRAMVASAHALARSLDMTLVIEGVSSERVLQGLLALGCETGQGFYLARPMTGHDLLQWLDKSGRQR